jgi:O-antigen ligase
MNMTTTDRYSSAFDPRPQAAGSASPTFSRKLVYVLLAVASYIAYFRSTAMGYGYPSYQDQLGESDVRFLGYLNYLVAALGCIYILLDGPFLLRIAMRSPAVLFGILLIFATFFVSDDPVWSVRAFITVVFIALPVIAFAARFGVESALDLFRRFCIFAIALNVLYIAAFPNYAIMGGEAGFRGMFAHKNQFGPFMAIAVVMLFPSGKRSAVENLVATGACFVALLFVALSRSASAWVMLMAAPPLYVGLRLVLMARDRTVRSMLVAGAALSVSAAILVAYFYLFDSLLGLLGRDATLTGRTKMWGFLIDEIWNRPFFGHGFGTFSRPDAFTRFWLEFGWNAGSTHNSYLEFLLNVGFVVAIYWAFVLLKTARANLVSYREMLPSNIVKQQIVTIMILLSAFSQANHFFAGAFFWLTLLLSLFHDDTPPAGKVRRRRKIGLQRQGRGSGAVIPGTATS